MYTLSNGIEIRTSLKEMNIKEFEKISDIMTNENLLTIEKYIAVLEILEVPLNVIDDLEDEELFAIIKSFNEYEYENTLLRTIEVDGYTYEAFPEGATEPKLKAKDMAIIEKGLRNKKGLFLNTLAVIFKRTDLGKTEHTAEAHIKHKRELFSKLNAADYYPYIVWITNKIHSRIQKNTENLEETNAE